MTIMKEQLDAYQRELDLMRLDGYCDGHGQMQLPTDHIAQLIAIARAALAWRDARLARQAVQVRAGVAETNDEHSTAMRELPAAKEADVLACMELLSALEQP